MASKEKLKAILILGKDDSSYNKYDFVEIKQLYSKPGFKLIGNTEDGVTREDIISLKGQIDSNTRIDFLGHGSPYKKDYIITVGKETISIANFFVVLKEQYPEGPIHVHLWSCFAELAIAYTRMLGEGSILFAYVPRHSTSFKDLNLSSIKQAILKLEHGQSPFQNFLDNFVTNSYQSSYVSTQIKGRIENFEFSPSLKGALFDTQATLEKKAKEFKAFYKTNYEKLSSNQIRKDKSYTYFKQKKLKVKEISWQEQEDFKIGYFIHVCGSGNFKELERVSKDKRGTEVIKELINKDIKGLSTSALFIPAAKGDVKTVKFLLDFGIDPNKKSLSGQTALYLASQKEKVNVVEVLLEYRANPNEPNRFGGDTPIFIAAAKDNVEITNTLIDRLIEQKANPDRQNDEGNTPLIVASARGYTEIAKALLKKYKANPDIANLAGMTSLTYSAQNGHEETTRVLLENKATVDKPRSEDGATPLLLASEQGQLNVVRALVQFRADPSISTNNKNTPLCAAAFKGYKEIVVTVIMAFKRLFKLAEGIDQFCYGGVPVLYRAVQPGHYEVTEELLKFGANPNKASEFGATPLGVAVFKGFNNLLKLLVRYGGDCTIRAKNGENAIDVARSKGNLEAVEICQKGKNHLEKPYYYATELKPQTTEYEFKYHDEL